MKIKFKRFIDIIGSITGLFITSAVFIFVSLINYITMGRPIFFKQIRPGLHAKPFVLYRCRNMLDIKDKNRSHLPDEKTHTGFEKFLRKTSLDELRELWNVLKGDISLVGPRPLLMEYLDRYTPIYT